MTAGRELARFIIDDGNGDNDSAQEGSGYPFTVGVRLHLGERMGGLEVFDDGISFRSPTAIPGGQIIELILGHGAVLVDAMVVGCVPITDDEGGYAIRARYHKTSEALNALINEEFTRLMRESG